MSRRHARHQRPWVVHLAQQTHLSARQFNRVFKADTGTTPANYIEAIRTEAACRLLETTRAPIEEIARR